MSALLFSFMQTLQNIINSHHEWLLIYVSGKSFSLKNSEIELEFTNNKLLFSFPADQGFQTWRVTDFKPKNNEIILDLTRNFEKEHIKIRLVPRILANELTENLELARLEKAVQIAQIVKENSPNSKIVRVELNKENGRFAHIIFENSLKKQTAVLADVTDKLTPEILLSTAILWLAKLSARRKNPIEQIWLCAEKKQAKNLQKLHALLRENWKNSVLIKEISRTDNQTLKDLPSLEIAELWRGKTKEIKSAENFQTSETAHQITEFAPGEIDAIFARNGETLRFSGLPFARIRKISDTEKVWLGVEKSKQLLSENNFDEFAELLENLREFRSYNSPNKRHVFYQSAPEAWLESILRKNVKLLDANLILSPVYHQFRAERDKIDLLALRRDGRLVIIELKIEPDREMIFQAADYWRKIERARRSGNLQKAKLFGDLEIADAPAICYLVAPTLCFHRDFDYLKNTISDEIEIHRFNLAENWRESLKVLERI
jgi:hypothetical protein